MALFGANLLEFVYLFPAYVFLASLFFVNTIGVEPVGNYQSRALARDVEAISDVEMQLSPPPPGVLQRRTGELTAVGLAETQRSASSSSHEATSSRPTWIVGVHWKDELCGPETRALPRVPRHEATILDMVCGHESRPTDPAKTELFRQLFLRHPSAMMQFIVDVHPHFRQTFYENPAFSQQRTGAQLRSSQAGSRPRVTPDAFRRVLTWAGQRAGEEAGNLTKEAQRLEEEHRQAHPEDWRPNHREQAQAHKLNSD